MRRLIPILLILALFCNPTYAGFGGFLQANTAVDVTVGPFIDDTDGKTAETGLTITEAEVFLTKNGGGYADKSEATSLSHVGLGNYTCKLDTTDTNTEGILTLMIHESGALAVKVDYQVLAQAAYISLMTAKDTGYMGVDVEEVDGTDQTGNDNGADINTIVTAVGNIETDTAAQDTAGEWDTLMATVDGKLDTAQADLDTITGASGVLIDTDAVDADALKADAVTEIWAKAMVDIAAGAPDYNCTVLLAVNYLYEAWRNQTWATSTEIAIYKNDASTPLVESTISDDGTTFKREEMRAPD